MKYLILTIFVAMFAVTAFGQETNSPAWEHGEGTVVNNALELQEPSKEPLKLFIPNAFSPNDDGINDIYYITSSYFNSMDFSVFDRWGNEIFTSNVIDFRWNGKVQNKRVTAGVYVYVFNGVTKDGTKIRRSGTISVVF